jgi:hypothetical protein
MAVWRERLEAAKRTVAAAEESVREQKRILQKGAPMTPKRGLVLCLCLEATWAGITGWRVVPVAGLVPGEIFFDHLPNGVSWRVPS